MKSLRNANRSTLKLASAKWGKLPHLAQRALTEICAEFSLSISLGDIQYLDGKWYVTHSGLLRIARRNRCSGIRVQPVYELCDSKSERWTFKAIVYKSRSCKGFVGYGDANPSNVSALVRGAEMRVAETRAVNRALRKAYGIGLCSVEEIGSFSGPLRPPANNNCIDPQNGHPVRDRLRLLIRQYRLDAGEVKRYATAFCGSETLRQADREQVEKFVNHLEQLAQEGREKVLEQLARFGEVPSATNDTKEAA